MKRVNRYAIDQQSYLSTIYFRLIEFISNNYPYFKINRKGIVSVKGETYDTSAAFNDKYVIFYKFYHKLDAENNQKITYVHITAIRVLFSNLLLDILTVYIIIKLLVR